MNTDTNYIDKDNKFAINSIIKGDSIEILKQFPDKCIDCIYADPPYFMQSSDKELQRADGTGTFKGCDDEWDKYEGYIQYDDFTNKWLKQCKRVLKDTGTIWVIGSFQNVYRLGYIMQNLGFWILNDIVWNKTNPTPNMAGTRFCNAHETMLWCSKSKNAKFTFNYKTMKYLNGDKQEKSVWTLGICQGSERLKGPDGKKLHTTQKPLSLLEKVILSSTKPCDIVLDPFFGTGTTGAAAKKYGRNYIGIEREQKYIYGAEKRLEAQVNESNDISNLVLEVKPPRIPLTALKDIGLITTNETLYDKNGTARCFVMENGKVNVMNNDVNHFQQDKNEKIEQVNCGQAMSIHKLAAQILNKANYNGWNYFYVKRGSSLILIDKLRYQAAKIIESGMDSKCEFSDDGII